MLITSRYFLATVIDYLSICQSIAKNNQSSKDSFLFWRAPFLEWVIDGQVQQAARNAQEWSGRRWPQNIKPWELFCEHLLPVKKGFGIFFFFFTFLDFTT
jgi:hypothetical protein